LTGITTYISIPKLNVDGLNFPIKIHCLANWIKKEDPTICCLQETQTIDRNKPWLRVKGKKIYQANGLQKQARVAILISDKVDFKCTLNKQDKEGHAVLIKGETHQKEKIIIDPYAPNTNVPNFIKHTLKDLKIYIDSNTVVVGGLIPPYYQTKINKEILELNHIIDQRDLADVYRYYIQLLHNIHSSQEPMETSPKLIISYGTKQA
jgi:hypothetical protein